MPAATCLPSCCELAGQQRQPAEGEARDEHDEQRREDALDAARVEIGEREAAVGKGSLIRPEIR